jgi:hypothetical protein
MGQIASVLREPLLIMAVMTAGTRRAVTPRRQGATPGFQGVCSARPEPLLTGSSWNLLERYEAGDESKRQ